MNCCDNLFAKPTQRLHDSDSLMYWALFLSIQHTVSKKQFIPPSFENQNPPFNSQGTFESKSLFQADEFPRNRVAARGCTCLHLAAKGIIPEERGGLCRAESWDDERPRLGLARVSRSAASRFGPVWLARAGCLGAAAPFVCARRADMWEFLSRRNEVSESLWLTGQLLLAFVGWDWG